MKLTGQFARIVAVGWMLLGTLLAQGTSNLVSSAGNSAGAVGYQLRPGDEVQVTVYDEPELASKVKIENDGTVALPLIGRIKIRGLTTEAAGKVVEEAYGSDYLRKPMVTLTLSSRAPLRFTVMGQSAKPGVYEIPPGEPITVLKAIALAGGFTRIADRSDIKVKRSKPEGTTVVRLNGKAIAAATQPDFVIEPDDEITIGESAF